MPTRKADAVIKAVLRERAVAPRQDVLRQGDIPKIAHVLLKGHTCRYRMLSDGRRQITAVLVPGDICDLEAVMRGRADYSVGAISACTLGEIPAERISDPTAVDPGMARALWRQLLRDEAIAREWLVGLGRRSARERVAHLFCELWIRLRDSGLVQDGGYNLQFTQIELADVLGLSVVHVNRMLQELRRSGLIRLSRSHFEIVDYPGLAEVAGFDPCYLEMA